MARSLESRVSRLEAPRGDVHRMAAHNYAILKACYAVLSRVGDEPMPTDAELMATAQAEAASERPPDYTAALEAVWRDADAL